jgi:hypothetical protein
LAAALAVLTVSPADAQTGTGSIQGVVTDGSGAALPGVRITARSPALQVPELNVVSGADGAYQFRALPLGLYELNYELAGFQSFARQGLRLTAGFVATVNVTMEIGGLEETVTVSGASPVVDITTTNAQTTVTKEMLDSIPVGRHWIQALHMAEGIRVNTVDIGGSTMAGAPGYSAYGVSGQNTPTIEGLNTREAADAAGFHYDTSTFDEMQIQALGAGADVGTPGVRTVGIVKSGGNQFSGRYAFAGHHEKLGLQGHNVDDALRAQGVSEGTRFLWYFDASADLGGRIIRDKLWFYGAYRRQQNRIEEIGYVKDAGPDGIYGTGDDVSGRGRPGRGEPAETLKVSYQPAVHSKVIGFMQRNKGQIFDRGASSRLPYERTYDYYFGPTAAKLEYQATPTNSLAVNAVGGYVWYFANFRAQQDVDRPGNPSRRDIATGWQWGPPNRIYRSFRRHWQTAGDMTYYTDSGAGSHALKAGYDLHWEHRGGGLEPNRASGNYELVYDNGRPIQIITANLPLNSQGSRMDNFAFYIQDSWTLGRKLTMNLGLRAERYHNYVDPATKEQGPFGDAGSFPGVDIQTWDSFVPRVGFAYDVTGKAKTVLKGTFGVYAWNPSVDYSNAYNRDTLTTTTYRWTDPNGNGDYDPGEVNLDPNGPAFLSRSGAATVLLNPDLKQPRTYEASLSLEHELAKNFGLKARFVQKSLRNGLEMGYTVETVNVLRPYSAWDVPMQVRDPGPDGAVGTADDGDFLTIYDYNPAFRGASFVGNMPVNASDDRVNRYRSFEFTAIKRRSHNFDVIASVVTTKNHRFINGVVRSPNDELFPMDENWRWDFKLASSYTAPYDINVAAFYTALSGEPQRRTYTFRGLPQSGTLTLPMEALGAQKLPDQHVVNFRLGKLFRIGRYRLEPMADLFNALNANTVTSRSFVSGPNYGTINTILLPRTIRLGTTLTF